MKKLIILCLLCSCLSLTACESKSADSQETKAATSEETTDSVDEESTDSAAEETGKNTDSTDISVETNEASVTVE